MRALRLCILILLVLAFGAITLGGREGITVYDLTNVLYQWGQTFDRIETGSTGVVIFDTMLKWKPLRFIASSVSVIAFAGSFAINLFIYWWG